MALKIKISLQDGDKTIHEIEKDLQKYKDSTLGAIKRHKRELWGVFRSKP